MASLIQLTYLDLSDTRAGDRELEWLRGLTAIVNLRLDRTRVSDRGLARLAGLVKLRWLSLEKTKVEGWGIASLLAAAPIDQLNAQVSLINDEVAAKIARAWKSGLTSHLNFARTRVTGPGLSGLSGLKAWSLDLSGLPLTGPDLSTLGSASIESLELAENSAD